MKFLLENVQQAKLSGASAVAIKRLCVVCSPAMSAHLPSLLQLAQSVDHIPLSNASVNWLIEGLHRRPRQRPSTATQVSHGSCANKLTNTRLTASFPGQPE